MVRPRALAAPGLLALGLAALLVLPAALAQTGVSGPAPRAFSDPSSQTQARINGLFDGILPVSIVIGVLVEALLVYAVVRFRAKAGKVASTGEHERGHHRLEIAWTIPPAVILLTVGLLSAQTLTAIENPPVAADSEEATNIRVVASQWTWEFRYPDNSSDVNELWLAQGATVLFEVVSRDVIHSWNIPDMGVKIDAVPGRTNHYWFSPDRTGEFLAQCTEYCGAGHGYMRALLHVFPAGGAKTYGNPAAVQGGGLNLTADQFVNLTAKESGCPKTFCFEPSSALIRAGKTIGVVMTNPAGNGAHNICVQVNASGAPECAPGKDAYVAGGKQAGFTFTAPGSGTLQFWCNVPGHRTPLGMEGTLTVG
jgi:cytochrome c oxidase subunit 2